MMIKNGLQQKFRKGICLKLLSADIQTFTANPVGEGLAPPVPKHKAYFINHAVK
jgi:hypothetical protein